MEATTFLFFIFSFLLLVSATLVIASKHPVFSLLFLASTFIMASFLLFLLECEFLALIFIIVYVGAISILFLFAIMMLESKFIDLSKNTMKYLPIGTLFAIVLFLPLHNEISNFFEDNPYRNSFYVNTYQNWFDLIDSTMDVEVLGHILYSYYVLQFLVSGLILILVLIGVVYLTNNFNKTRAEQSVFKQLSRKSNFLYINSDEG